MNDVGVVVHLLRFIDEKLQILFLFRAWGKYINQWWPIAGIIKDEESPSFTAFREIKEETGLVPEQLYDTGMTVPHFGPNAAPDEKIRIYVGFVSADEKICLNYEHIDFRWVDFDQAINIVTPKAADITGYVLNRIKEKYADNIPPESLRIMRST
jgi:dihydroneopterin triphosphate diphosphatase